MAIPKILMSWGFLIYQEKIHQKKKCPLVEFGAWWVSLFSDDYFIEFK